MKKQKLYRLEWYVEGKLKETLDRNIGYGTAKYLVDKLKRTNHKSGKLIIVPMQRGRPSPIVEVLVKSNSFITKFLYDKKKQTLDVLMKGGEKYRYYDITLNRFTRLQNSPSKGSYYATKIRSKYPMRRVIVKNKTQLKLNFKP